MKDGMSAAADWFEMIPESVEAGKDQNASLKDKLKKSVKPSGNCPNDLSVTPVKDSCDKCVTREGCPAWA
jgi:hypothetical protein